jgi:hypothetical protein
VKSFIRTAIALSCVVGLTGSALAVKWVDDMSYRVASIKEKVPGTNKEI